VVEFDAEYLIIIIFGIGLGIPFLVTCFHIIRRLRELHKEHNKYEGELFVSDGGEIFSEFHIPIGELTSKDYILLKVTKVEPKGGNTNGNVSAETYKT
jgi:hypothetical protein